MSKATDSLRQLNKANRLVNRTFHKNGPKSFKKGEGALLKVLYKNDGTMTSRELVDALAWDRPTLKDVVKKAERRGNITISESDEKKTYIVAITPEGNKIAEKRCIAQKDTAESIMEALTDEEIAQLNELTDKLIVRCKELGAHGKRHVVKKCRHHHGKRHGKGKCCKR